MLSGDIILGSVPVRGQAEAGPGAVGDVRAGRRGGEERAAHRERAAAPAGLLLSFGAGLAARKKCTLAEHLRKL